MPIRFVNDKVKIYLAQKGVPSVFGREVDIREKLSGAEAIAWFDRVWDAHLAKEVENVAPGLRLGTLVVLAQGRSALRIEKTPCRERLAKPSRSAPREPSIYK